MTYLTQPSGCVGLALQSYFSTIFVFALIGLILLISTLGILGREGNPGEERFFLKPEWRWPYRIFGFVVFLLLIQFTGML